MKQLEKLQSLVRKLKPKEVNQFRRYAEYKRKKKALKLFDLVLKSKDEPTVDRLQIDIKRNNLHRDINHFARDLYKLILMYWDDKMEPDKIMKANKLINHARILNKKGLGEESIRYLEKVMEMTLNSQHIDQSLTVNRLIYTKKAMFKPKHSLQLADDFLEQQLKTIERVAHLSEILTLFYKAMYFIRKGILMLDEAELQQLLEIRTRSTELFETPDLPVLFYLQTGLLLADLYIAVPPNDLTLAEHYLQGNLKRTEEGLDDNSMYSLYCMQIYSYMILLFTMKRVEDYSKYRKVFSEARPKIKTTSLTFESIHQATNVGVCLLKYDMENADKTIEEAWKFIKENDQEIYFVYNWNILFSGFQLAIAKGDLVQAELFEEQLSKSKLFNNEKKKYKFIARIASLLLHYEKNNYDLVINSAESVKRLYSGHMKKNTGAKLLLKLLVQLSATPGKKEQSMLFTGFLQKINTLFDEHPAHRFTFLFVIMEDWAEAKLNGFQTIFDYKNNHQL